MDLGRQSPGTVIPRWRSAETAHPTISLHRSSSLASACQETSVSTSMCPVEASTAATIPATASSLDRSGRQPRFRGRPTETPLPRTAGRGARHLTSTATVPSRLWIRSSGLSPLPATPCLTPYRRRTAPLGPGSSGCMRAAPGTAGRSAGSARPPACVAQSPRTQIRSSPRACDRGAPTPLRRRVPNQPALRCRGSGTSDRTDRRCRSYGGVKIAWDYSPAAGVSPCGASIDPADLPVPRRTAGLLLGSASLTSRPLPPSCEGVAGVS